MRQPPLLALCLPLAGCVFAYGPTAPAPGLAVPATSEGAGDVALTAGLARQVGDRVTVTQDGTRQGDESLLPSWPYFDLGIRQEISDDVGLEARLGGSLVLPIPIPVPNGLSLAPMFRVADLGEHGRVDISPRGVITSGLVYATFEDQSSGLATTGYGVELPATISWQPRRWIHLNTTPYVRAFYVVGQPEEDGVEGQKAGWITSGGGLTGNALLTVAFFRVGIGGGLEVVPDPAAGLECPACEGDRAPVTVAPQLAISLGFAWGGGEER